MPKLDRFRAVSIEAAQKELETIGKRLMFIWEAPRALTRKDAQKIGLIGNDCLRYAEILNKMKGKYDVERPLDD